MPCPACLNNNTQEVFVNLPFFRHIDFTTCENNQKLIKCTECQTISNPGAINKEIPKFVSKKYARNNITERTIQLNDYPVPVTRSKLQSKLFVNRFPNIKRNSKILDIGCFDGRMMNELDSMLSNAEFWGFDINPHLKELFPSKKNFHFVTNKLDELEGPFDLISLSHSIIYIPNFYQLIKSINLLIKDDGVFFIQIPNIRTNPYYLLMGDQHFTFTEISLKNVLRKYGYISEVIKTNYFPNELLISAQKVNHKNPVCDKDDYLDQATTTLEKYKKNILKLKQEDYNALGTTVNAAFVDEFKSDNISFFVDEDKSKIGEYFRGKKIIHPKSIDKKHTTIIAYNNMNNILEETFIKKYGGKYLKI